jgi:hypothetical protein
VVEFGSTQRPGSVESRSRFALSALRQERAELEPRTGLYADPTEATLPSMGKLRMTFHYAVRGLLVQEGLLGADVSVPTDGGEVIVTFPLQEAQEEGAESASPAPAFNDRFPAREDMPLVDGARDLHVVMSAEAADSDTPRAAEVDLLRAVIVLDGVGVSAADYAPDGKVTQASHERLTAAMNAASSKVDQAIERLIAWSRIQRRQTWLGLYGESVERAGSDEVVDLDAKRRLPWPARADFSFKVVERDAPWTSTTLSELPRLITDRGLPAVAETLLADADFLILWAKPRDPARALLVAAVACEVKIKNVLQELATDVQAPLVELVLENPRDWSMAASALFHKPLRAITGSSLKDVDPQLYGRVRGLFERRNALAHRGHAPAFADAFDAVKAAREVFTWLDTLAPATP